MTDQDDQKPALQPQQDAVSTPKANGADCLDDRNPLFQELVTTITGRAMQQVDPLLVELKKIIAENTAAASPSDDDRSQNTQAAARPPATETHDNADRYVDDALIDQITETVVKTVMSHVTPVLQDLSKLKQGKEHAASGLPNSAALNPQTVQDQVMNRVMELENLIKQKISARELRFQAMTTRKPPSR